MTRVCLRASKISKTCLLGCPTGQATSWKANFENCSRYSLIKWKSFSIGLLAKSPEARFLIVWLSINHFFVHPKIWLQIPCTCSPPTTNIHSTSGQIHIWNPVENLYWGFFAKASYMLRSLAVFTENYIADVWRGSKCDSVCGEGFHHWGCTGKSWTPPAS